MTQRYQLPWIQTEAATNKALATQVLLLRQRCSSHSGSTRSSAAIDTR